MYPRKFFIFYDDIFESMLYLKLKIKKWLCRNPKLATNGKVLIYGGDSAYPPEPPLRFAIVSYYLPGSYCFWRVP
jgi:hypothetical protein